MREVAILMAVVAVLALVVTIRLQRRSAIRSPLDGEYRDFLVRLARGDYDEGWVE